MPQALPVGTRLGGQALVISMLADLYHRGPEHLSRQVQSYFERRLEEQYDLNSVAEGHLESDAMDDCEYG